MKRLIALLCIALFMPVLLAASAAAGSTHIFASLPASFIFMSGVGAWETRVHINADGTFSGLYEDWNMGEIEDEHPNGSLYQCRFSGAFTEPAKIDDFEYALRIAALTTEGVEGEERIIDGVKVVTANPYGFDNAGEFRLYLPGKDSSSLPQEYISWISPALSWEWPNLTIPSPLSFHGLYNVGGQQGFFGSDGASWENGATPVAVAPTAGASASHVIGTLTVTATDSVVVRNRGSQEGNPLVRISAGGSYPCVGQDASGWYMVYCSDYIGYVPAGSVAFSPREAQASHNDPLRGVARITSNDFANIRSTPDPNGEWLAGVSPGVTLDCVDVAANGWYCVVLPSGARGYVSNKLCSLQ